MSKIRLILRWKYLPLQVKLFIHVSVLPISDSGFTENLKISVF